MNIENYIYLSFEERLQIVEKPFYEIFYSISSNIYDGFFEIPTNLIHEILDSELNKRMAKITIIL